MNDIIEVAESHLVVCGLEYPKAVGSQIAFKPCLGIALPLRTRRIGIFDDRSAETVKDVRFITVCEIKRAENLY